MSRAREAADHLARTRKIWLPKAAQKGRPTRYYFELGDAAGAAGKSLRVPWSPDKRGLRDFGNCFAGDDLNLLMELQGLDVVGAIRWAEENAGLPCDRLTGDRPRARPKARPAAAPPERPAAPAKPNGAAIPDPPDRHPYLGEPVLRHEYTDAAGNLIFYHCRFIRPDDSKEYRPLTYKNGRWQWCDPDGLLPLYGLAELAARPTDPVLVLEGEKKTDIARELLPNDVVIGWPHGADGVDKVDWSPLAGRRVTLWPDNDEAGIRAVGKVAAACRAAGAASVRVVELPPGLPPKWDLGDPLPDDWDIGRVEHLIGTATAPPTKLRAVDFNDLLTMPLPKREPLLGPWLVKKGLVEVYGWRGTGKTLFALGVAIAVASGGRFLRWQADKRRPVLYLDGELPADALRDMAATTAAALGLKPQPGMLTLVTPDLLDGFPPNLATEEGQAAVDELLPGAALLVVDNLATLTGQTEENEGASWLPIQDYLLRLRRRDHAAMVLHHANKTGSSRGHSRRQDVLDTVIALRHPDDYSPEQGARFALHFEKGRGIRGDAAKPFEAWLTTEADGTPAWTVRDIGDEHLDEVVRLTVAGLTVRAIGGEIGISKSAVSRLQLKARQKGMLNDASEA